MADAAAQFVRALGALLLAGLLLPAAATAAGEETQEPERVWYQVEVVLVERTGADTRERFPTDARPRWPRDVLALGPVWPQPVRPRNVGELFALWQDLDATPGLRRVTPGLSPETEDLIRWLRGLEGSGSDPGMPWLPEPGADGRPWWNEAARTGAPDDAGSGSGDAPTEPATGPAAEPEAPREVPLESLALEDVELERIETQPPDPEDIPIPMALAFREVAPAQRLLQEEVRRLERVGGYRVLAHRAWRQPFLPEAPALPVRIEHEDPASGEIDLAGSVGIALRRYLHARLELYRRVPVLAADLPTTPRSVEGIATQQSGRGPGPVEIGGNGVAMAAPPEVTDGWIRIVHERRMRSGETHYLDHPRIAVLIRIEPFLLAQPLEEDGEIVRAVRD